MDLKGHFTKHFLYAYPIVAHAMGRPLETLPKAELHLHLEGAMRPETLTELCLKHAVERPLDTRGRRFEDFEPFKSCYLAVCECLREPGDLYRLVSEVAEDAKSSGALWLELALSIELYAHRFGPSDSACRSCFMLFRGFMSSDRVFFRWCGAHLQAALRGGRVGRAAHGRGHGLHCGGREAPAGGAGRAPGTDGPTGHGHDPRPPGPPGLRPPLRRGPKP